METILGFGSTFYWILAASLLTGLLILSYVWREFLGWFLRTHELIKEVRSLRSELTQMRDELKVIQAHPRAPLAPSVQPLELIEPVRSPEKHQFPLR